MALVLMMKSCDLDEHIYCGEKLNLGLLGLRCLTCYSSILYGAVRDYSQRLYTGTLSMYNVHRMPAARW